MTPSECDLPREGRRVLSGSDALDWDFDLDDERDVFRAGWLEDFPCMLPQSRPPNMRRSHGDFLVGRDPWSVIVGVE